MESEEKNLNPENGENQPINQPEATQPQAENAPENLADQAATESKMNVPPIAAPEPNVATQTNKVKDSVASIKKEIQQVLVGMDEVIDQALVAMFSDGHVLFEGFPGVAKTLMVKLISKTLSTGFKRIQFTPDMMPSDVIGTNIFDQKTSDFIFKKGPIFSNLVLIDEINRAPAKTQAALFEVMEERQITVEGKAYKMDYPFLVIATQNPIDQEGTYRLPEAQLDRFIFKVKVPYPTLEQETQILQRFKTDFDQKTVIEKVKTVMNPADLKACFEFIQTIHISDQILGYIARIVHETRNHPNVYLGASPRASLSILKASKAFAAIDGRNFVAPDDVQKACYPILNHRIILNASAEMEGYSAEDVIGNIINDIEVP